MQAACLVVLKHAQHVAFVLEPGGDQVQSICCGRNSTLLDQIQHEMLEYVACILLLQDEQAAVMERLVWEPRPAELLSTVHFRQVWH